MTVGKPFAIASSTATVVAWRDRPRVERIHLSNKLDGKRRDAPGQDDFASPNTARAKLCRSETADVAPIREEPRLVPAFVTQLLAQIMETREAATNSAAAAYRNGLPKIALLCDRDA
jgi:hypothetical protein